MLACAGLCWLVLACAACAGSCWPGLACAGCVCYENLTLATNRVGEITAEDVQFIKKM